MNSEISPLAQVQNSKIGNHCIIMDGSRFCYSELGDYSYVSRNSNIFSSVIGRFCSISWNVSIGPANHDYSRFTTHPILFASRFEMIRKGEERYNQYKGEIKIGNDVWIGCNALIIRKEKSLVIGDGAVIGANAVITKDVPPYSIVVGRNEILRYRFNDDIINALLELQWWNLPGQIIKENIDILSQRPSVELINELKSSKI